MHKEWLRGIASAPLAAALGVASIGLTAMSVLDLGGGGRMSTVSAVGLGLAALLAVLATAQASRPVSVRQPPQRRSAASTTQTSGDEHEL